MSGRRRILAVDFGDRRTGLAATDPGGILALPLETLEGLDDATCAEEIAAVARQRGAEVIVGGVPLRADGTAGGRAQRTLAFLRLLAARAPCPVEVVDESHTTDEAHERLKSAGLKAARRKRRADAIAAVVILERYRLEGGSPLPAGPS